MNTLTATTKTVKVLLTEQDVIRCTAKIAMPEYGIKAGDVFFLSRGSEVDTFYVVVYDDKQNKYVCGHPTSKKAKPCTHVQAVSSYCQKRAKREAPIPLAERGTLNGNRPFSILKAS